MTSNVAKIHSHISKSHEAFDDALFLINDNRFLAAINRLYYAAFNIVTAHFISQNIIVKSHKGTNAKLYDEMVKTNIITTTEGQIFSKLFKLRGEADYGDFVSFDIDEMKELYNDTENFIQKIESLITTNE